MNPIPNVVSNMFISIFFFETKYKFVMGDGEGSTDATPVCGLAHRDWGSFRDLFFDQQSFLLTVMPGVDIALALGTIIIVQEQEEKERQKR